MFYFVTRDREVAGLTKAPVYILVDEDAADVISDALISHGFAIVNNRETTDEQIQWLNDFGEAIDAVLPEKDEDE